MARLSALLLGALACMASASPRGRVLMEPDAKVGCTMSWSMGEHATSADTMQLHVMMKHEAADLKSLEQKLLEVSDPRSNGYGMHLTIEEIAKVVPVAEWKLDAVRELFANAPSASLKVNTARDIVVVTINADEAEALFNTTVHKFHHKRQPVTVLRASSEYSLPAKVASAVSLVGDLVALPAVRETLKSSQVGGSGTWDNACPTLSGCKGLVTPAVLHTAYKVPTDTTGMDATGNSMAVSEFQGQYYKDTDISKFGTACNVKVTVDANIGKNQESAGVESELDVEYIKGVSPGIPLTVVYNQAYSLLAWAQQVGNLTNSPLVHSVSYGNDEKQQTSAAYMESANTQFMMLGARGISVLFASGDQGVCGREGCGGFLSKTRFKPDFPAASPYITAVGGTDFVTYDIGEEQVWSDGGGGFSDEFAIPSWQADVVAAYKANKDANLPDASYWNNTGRGYPDVAALGGQKTSYCVVTNGLAEGVAGTSASCPVVAAVFARLNGVRLKAGGKPLGFLNPWIYQNADAFNDVTKGSNPGNGKIGFTAVAGWDPATGVGTPNFEAMAKKL